MAVPDKDCLHPDWDDGGHVHNWRNYVSEGVRMIWETFTPDQKRALAEQADDQAGREDWE